MIPILYSAAETNFTSNGLGALSSAISCKVRQEINGEYELEMQYPVSGLHYAQISLRTVIKAKPDKVTDPQPFRVYRITKPMAGIVTVYARHIVYDLSGIPVHPFSATGAAGAMAALKNNAAVSCPFDFSATIGGGRGFSTSVPASAWALLGKDGLLGAYGGEYRFDKYNVVLNAERTVDNGVAIRYGKNLLDLEQESNCANCYTGVYPYWQNEEDVAMLPERIIEASGNYGYTRILPLDLSDDFKEKPNETQLRNAANQYMTAHSIGTPEVSWKVEFVALEDTEEYKGRGVLERISLGDTVLVEFEELGVNASARAVSAVYDCLLERFDSITLGKVKSTIADTITEQEKEIEDKPSKSMVDKISSSLAAAIAGANGGAVRLLDTNGDGEPDTLYIADNPDPAKAVRVWRFNYAGWAASETGYNGQFTMGATFEGGIMAHLINVANLFAENITMTGTFTNTTEAFLEPNRAVVERISRHLLGTELISSAETAKYDFNNDGKISGTDLVLAQAAALGNRSFADWSGAVETPVTCTINLSTPSRALVMSGTDMWGNYRESVIGVDPAVATFASKEHLGSIVQMDVSGGMYRTIDGETEWFNPPMEIGVEYRTTKRFEGNPVYTMAVACGDMPKSGGLNIPHGCAAKKIVSCRGVTGAGIALPYVSAAGGRLWVSANRVNVVLYSSYDNEATSIVATIEYTKS